MKDMPSADYLCECFEYLNGMLFWRKRPDIHFTKQRTANSWNAKNAGKRAGRIMRDGLYRQVGIDGRRYLEHRIIAAMHGMRTNDEIDHKDGNGLNNCISNLRPATRQQNCQNNAGWKRKAERAGVHRGAIGWKAYIRENKKLVVIGTFKTEADAECARLDAESRVYGEFGLCNRANQ